MIKDAAMARTPTRDMFIEMNRRAGLVLRQLRQARNERQFYLAMALECSQANISEWERGERPIPYYAWKAIAAHYHKDLRALLLSIAAPATLWDIAKHELREDKS